MEIDTAHDLFWRQSEQPDSLGAVLPPQSVIIQLQPAFFSLEILVLQVGMNADIDNKSTIIFGIAALISHASGLEKLALRISGDLYESDPNRIPEIDLLNYMPEVTWPKLRHLDLTIASTEVRFLQLFRRHALTLEHLGLNDCGIHVDGGRWKPVILALPLALRLQTVKISGLWDDGSGDIEDICVPPEDDFMQLPWNEMIQNYIIHGGPMPSF